MGVADCERGWIYWGGIMTLIIERWLACGHRRYLVGWEDGWELVRRELWQRRVLEVLDTAADYISCYVVETDRKGVV